MVFLRAGIDYTSKLLLIGNIPTSIRSHAISPRGRICNLQISDAADVEIIDADLELSPTDQHQSVLGLFSFHDIRQGGNSCQRGIHLLISFAVSNPQKYVGHLHSKLHFLEILTGSRSNRGTIA